MWVLVLVGSMKQEHPKSASLACPSALGFELGRGTASGKKHGNVYWYSNQVREHLLEPRYIMHTAGNATQLDKKIPLTEGPARDLVKGVHCEA